MRRVECARYGGHDGPGCNGQMSETTIYVIIIAAIMIILIIATMRIIGRGLG